MSDTIRSDENTAMTDRLRNRYLLTPLLIACYRAAMQRLNVRRIPPRLLTSLENGVAFEDALGRSSILPYDLVRTWDVDTQLLRLLVLQRRFHDG